MTKTPLLLLRKTKIKASRSFFFFLCPRYYIFWGWWLGSLSFLSFFITSKFFFLFFFWESIDLLLSQRSLSLFLSLFLVQKTTKKNDIFFKVPFFLVWATLGRHRNHPSPLHKKSPHAYITTIMSAALTSSTFVGAKVSVAKTTTVSKRAAFSVQANSSGPKRVRIPSRDFSLFFSLSFCTPVVCTRGADDVFESK